MADQTLRAMLDALTEDMTPDMAADFVITKDTSASLLKKVKPSNLGYVGGSTGATDNAILRADGTGGKTAQNSGVSIDDSGIINAPNGTSYSSPAGLSGGSAFGINASAQFQVTSAFNGVIISSLYGGTQIGSSGAQNSINNMGAGVEGSAWQQFPPKSLTNNTTTTIATIALATLKGTGGSMTVSVFCTDGTDVQMRTQIVRWEAVNKAGTYTTDIAIVSEGISASSGTLTGTWSITTGSNIINLRFNANSSLTPTTLRANFIVHTMNNVMATPI